MLGVEDPGPLDDEVKSCLEGGRKPEDKWAGATLQSRLGGRSSLVDVLPAAEECEAANQAGTRERKGNLSGKE